MILNRSLAAPYKTSARALRVALIASASALAACATGAANYTPPGSVRPVANVKLVDRPREAVWNDLVPQLGRQFFVINNLDKGSGLINVSYSGDPEQYVDCGMITARTQAPAGSTDIAFPGSRARQVYRVANNGYLVDIERSMLLDGRVNLVLEEVSPTQTRVSANTRYVVTRSQRLQQVGGPVVAGPTDSVGFTSANEGVFTPGQKNQIVCRPTGKIERELLDLVR